MLLPASGPVLESQLLGAMMPFIFGISVIAEWLLLAGSRRTTCHEAAFGGDCRRCERQLIGIDSYSHSRPEPDYRRVPLLNVQVAASLVKPPDGTLKHSAVY